MMRNGESRSRDNAGCHSSVLTEAVQHLNDLE
jgi:hypothetical protein